MAKIPLRILTSIAVVFASSVLPQSGSGDVIQAASQPLSPATRITRLDVEIKTRDEKNAAIGPQIIPGSNHVWLDLGFKGWDLSTIPTAAGTEPFGIKGGVDRWENLPLPERDIFTVDDLFELRIEKKGLGGFTHAGDGSNGGWKPESVTLFVNGKPFGDTLPVLPSGQSLDKKRPAWRHLFRPVSVEERFLLGLRVEPLEAGNWFEGLVAGITTPFKKTGLSGWQNGPLQQYRKGDQFTSDGDVKDDPAIEHVAVEGILYNPPSPGTDGYITLDLRLNSITIFNAAGTRTQYSVDNEGGVRHPRFIRVEYVRVKNGQPNDDRYKIEKWSIGDRFYAEGRILWDTDRIGFYELHPDFGESFIRKSPFQVESHPIVISSL